MTEFPDSLSALGRVEPPSPGTLDAAREVLWSAVAAEMLGTDPANDAGARSAERPGRTGEQRDADRPGRTGQQHDADRPGRTGEQRRGDSGPRHHGDPGPRHPGDLGS